MVYVPQARFSYCHFWRVQPQPICGRFVNRFLSKIAEQIYAVALQGSSVTPDTGGVTNLYPEEVHLANNCAHIALKQDFSQANALRCAVADALRSLPSTQISITTVNIALRT
jgi:hypothetical protein